MGEVPDIRQTFSKDKFRNLLKSLENDRNISNGWKNLLINISGVCLGERITALNELMLDQSTSTRISDKNIIIFRMKVGSWSGASKQMTGCLRKVFKKPTEVSIWNFLVLDDELNLYEELNE